MSDIIQALNEAIELTSKAATALLKARTAAISHGLKISAAIYDQLGTEMYRRRDEIKDLRDGEHMLRPAPPGDGGER